LRIDRKVGIHHGINYIMLVRPNMRHTASRVSGIGKGISVIGYGISVIDGME